MNSEIIRQWAVNVNSQESHLERFSVDQVKEVFGEQVFELTLHGSFDEQVKAYRFGSEITRWFFLAALILMVLEMLIGREDLFRGLPVINRFFREESSK